MVQEPERRVDHVTGARGDLGAATKTGEIVADVAVVLLDREGQILAGEELLRRDQPVEAFPVVGQEDTALDADLVEKSPAGRIITPTQLPGQGSPCHRVVGPPEPNLVFFPVHEVPHLIYLHDLARRLARGLRRGLAGRAHPPVDRDVAHAQEPGDHALAGVAHGVEQDRQGLHGLGFAALRRGDEVAAAGLAEVALVAPHRAVLDERRPGAPLAAHLDQPCPPDPAVEPSYQTVDLWVNVSKILLRVDGRSYLY